MTLDFRRFDCCEMEYATMRGCQFLLPGVILLASLLCQSSNSARGDEWADLSKRSSELREAGKYAESEKIEHRLLEMAQAQGSEIRIAVSLEGLGLLASDQGHYDDARFGADSRQAG